MCGVCDAREQRNTAPTQPCGLKKQPVLLSVVHLVPIPSLISRGLVYRDVAWVEELLGFLSHWVSSLEALTLLLDKAICTSFTY